MWVCMSVCLCRVCVYVRVWETEEGKGPLLDFHMATLILVFFLFDR